MNLPSILLLAASAIDPADRVGSGTIMGGWGYVWASYAITWTVLAAYGLNLWIRRPGASSKKVQE